MAVIPSMPGLEVQICVNGSPITEHRNDNRSPLHLQSPLAKTVAKKVEFAEGDEFEITLRVCDPLIMDCNALVMKAKIDDKVLLSRLLRRTQYEESGGEMTLLVDGVEERVGNKIFKRKLKCQRPLKNLESNIIDLTLNDSLLRSEPASYGGRIVVEVFRARVYLPTEESKAEDVRRSAWSATIHSATGTGTSQLHLIGLGEFEDARPQTIWGIKNLNPYPIANFVFDYGLKGDLQHPNSVLNKQKPRSPFRNRMILSDSDDESPITPSPRSAITDRVVAATTSPEHEDLFGIDGLVNDLTAAYDNKHTELLQAKQIGRRVAFATPIASSHKSPSSSRRKGGGNPTTPTRVTSLLKSRHGAVLNTSEKSPATKFPLQQSSAINTRGKVPAPIPPSSLIDASSPKVNRNAVNKTLAKSSAPRSALQQGSTNASRRKAPATVDLRTASQYDMDVDDNVDLNESANAKRAFFIGMAKAAKAAKEARQKNTQTSPPSRTPSGFRPVPSTRCQLPASWTSSVSKQRIAIKNNTREGATKTVRIKDEDVEMVDLTGNDEEPFMPANYRPPIVQDTYNDEWTI
ncbi:hypothetical protein B0J14DRAFT_252261 [Halenospora varia]|nr:hypothetical protein B0J14DRAFT_252261 [Halenospora varia]